MSVGVLFGSMIFLSPIKVQLVATVAPLSEQSHEAHDAHLPIYDLYNNQYW